MRFRILLLFLLVLLFAPITDMGSATPNSARLETVKAEVLPRLNEAVRDAGFTWGTPIFIRIFKEDAELEVWLKQNDGRFGKFKTFPICYYSGGLGPKLREGDRQSPQGFYFVTPTQLNPNSSYHLSFNLGFPNKYDRAQGRTGSFLMVHGNCVSIGCYAMTDHGIEEIYLLADAALQAGQGFFRTHVFPFHLTAENLKRYSDHQWRPFWENLRHGYEVFEKTHIPPNIEVENKRYVVR